MGSFVSACAYRIPRGISPVVNHSFCDHCLTPLAWHDLIPILSFVWLRGKCRTCSSKIPRAYPTIELLTAGIALAGLLKFGLTLNAAAFFTFAVLMLLVAMVDWSHLIIPNALLITATLFGLAYAGLDGITTLSASIASSLAAFGLLWSVRYVGSILLARESMGFGDVKLAGVIALFSGFWLFLLILWLASVLGSLHAAIRIVWAHSWSPSNFTQNAVRLPFGSYMAVSAVLCFYFRAEISAFFQLIWI